MPESIQIPKFTAPNAPPAPNDAPDSPMIEKGAAGPQLASIQPQQSVSTESFLDSVKEVNTKRQEAAKPVDTSLETKPIPEKKVDTTPNVFKKLDTAAKPEEKDKEVPDEGEEAVDFVDPLEAEPINTTPTKAKNIRELKTHLKTARAREAQLRTRNEELESEVTRLAGFQEKMEEHEALKERVAHLETYEKIFDIHSNPEFHEKYVEGAHNVALQAKQIAREYGVRDVGIIDQAVKIRNRKDLNEHLKRNGLDEYGISDIRPYIFHLQSLEDERVQLEKSPEQARETLSKMYRESEERRVADVTKTIQDKSVNAWNQISGHYSRGETAVDLFKDKPGDPEHSQRRTGVLRRANDEYMKAMGVLVGLGVKDMPTAVAHTLAARFQLSEGFGELAAENRSLREQNSELKKQLDSTTSYTRPSFSGVSRSQSNGDAPVAKANIAEHVFVKARDTLANRAAR